ncbi:MAG: rRNA maturation RNase YbeY [Aquihabitans sp.]
MSQVSVFVTDEQTDHEVDVSRWEELARRSLEDSGVTGSAELSLLFVDEATMAELNVEHMGEQGPTDVLSFPIDAEDVLTDEQDHHVLLGDVVICPAVAHRNAPGHAGTYPDEIALLTVHGILHVLGHDHAEPEETMVMQARERELLERFHRSVR